MARNDAKTRLEPQAKTLFNQGKNYGEVACELGVSKTTIYNWARRFRWDKPHSLEAVEEKLAARICYLTDKADKTDAEIKEHSELLRSFGMLRMDLARADAISRGIQVAPLFSTSKKARPDADAHQDDAEVCQADVKKRKGRPPKNDISNITQAMLDEVREKIFYGYQKRWHQAKNNLATCRTRFIVKSRQIGATYYFAWEALEDAILTGDNQIFLSASRDQALVFRAYMIFFMQEYFDMELKGSTLIVLSNYAEIRFLSTNSRTAQSYHGHLYIDEVFWIPKFKNLWKVAAGMSAHSKWRRTLFSTPSAISHEAYPLWSGEQFNKRMKAKEKIEFDVSHEALKDGALGEDRIWRHMVTVEDAVAQGCDKFNIDEIRLEWTEEDFKNLFLCEFIDDAESAFKLELLLRCGVEIELWTDYQPESPRPFGNRPVSIGYDPAHSDMGDPASMATGAIPLSFDEAWRVLRRKRLRGESFEAQAMHIEAECTAFNVQYLGIDATGLGQGVYQPVLGFYPGAEAILYSASVKNDLVVKCLSTMQQGRLKWDVNDRELVMSFLQIRKTLTKGTSQVTYVSGRGNGHNHADSAWAVMHMLKYEPIAGPAGGSTFTFLN